MVLGESFKPLSPKRRRTEPLDPIASPPALTTVPVDDRAGRTRVHDLKHESFVFKYTLSFLAASCAETITYPLDLIKGRLQIQGEKALTNYESFKGHQRAIAHRGMAGTALGI
ncbi:unnamed protein product, partial [Medioppia subpectinata]